MSHNSKTYSKRVSVIASVAVIALSTSLSPASAASSFGACSKSGSKMRIAGSTHTCGKNPTTKSTRLVWLPGICVRTNNNFLEKSKWLKEAEASKDDVFKKIDEAIAAWQTQIPDFEAAAKEKEALAVDAKREAGEAKARAATNRTKARTAGESTAAGKEWLLYATRWDGIAKTYERNERIALDTAAKLRGTVAKEIAALEAERTRVNTEIDGAKSDLNLLKTNRQLVCMKI